MATLAKLAQTRPQQADRRFTMAVKGAFAAEVASHFTAKSLPARLTAHFASITTFPRLLGLSVAAVSSEGQRQLPHALLQETTVQPKLSDSSKPPHSGGTPDFCAALGTGSLADSQDVVAALILSEAVYKVLDGSLEDAVEQTARAFQDFPAQLVQDLQLQWSLPHVSHRYLIAEGRQTLYVAFMGTKQRRDLFTNAAVVQELLWQEHRFSMLGEPAAHRGFLKRARSIPVRELYELAQSQGKRLVLCGHSLGGAVAELCTLDLLHSFRAASPPDVQAIGFATPAIGNEALAKYVRRRGWPSQLRTYLLPEDKIGSILGFNSLAEPILQEGLPSSEQLPRAHPVPAKAAAWKLPAAEKPARQGYAAERAGASRDPVARANISIHAVATTAAEAEGYHAVQSITTPSSGAANNIVSLRRMNSTPAIPATPTDSALERQKVALVAWAARFAARTATFPLWAHRSFTPAGQRLYLNPAGVSVHTHAVSSPPSQLAKVAVADSAQLGHNLAEVGTAASHELQDQQGNSILWMHRLPTYRTRLRQISGSPLKERGIAPKIILSTKIAPQMRATSAHVLHDFRACGGLGASHALLQACLGDCLRAAGLKFRRPWPHHWQQLLDASLANQASRRWRDIARGWMQALLRNLWGISAQEVAQDVTLLLQVAGTGLRHYSSVYVKGPDGSVLPTEVVNARLGLASLLSEGKHTTKAGPLGKFFSWLHLVGERDNLKQNKGDADKEPLLLRVQMLQVATAALEDPGCQGGLLVHLQSDFFCQQVSVNSEVANLARPSGAWTLKQGATDVLQLLLNPGSASG